MSSPDPQQRVLEHVIRVIETGGEVSLRLRDVVSETGVALATIYKYFESREGLLDSAYAEMYLRSASFPINDIKAGIAHCQNSDEFAALLTAFITAQFDPAAAQRRRTRMAVLGSAQARPELAAKIAETNRAYSDQFTPIFEEAKARGFVRPDVDIRAVSIWFLGYINTLAVYDISPEDWNEDEVNRIQVAAIVRAFVVAQ